MIAFTSVKRILLTAPMARTMKGIAFVFLFVSLAHIQRFAYAQRAGDATLVNTMGTVNCELLLSRLDYFAAEVSKEPGAAGFAVLHRGENPFVNAAYERGIKNNSIFRNFPVHLVQPIWGKGTGNFKIEMWKITGNTPPPTREEHLNYQVSNISGRTRFVKDSVEVINIDGKLNYTTGDNCVSEFNITVLSKVLSANSRLFAEIVIYNRSPRSARILSRLIRDAAVLENKISANRLKIAYAGPGIAKEWSHNVSAVEIWLQPTPRK